jgi:hypothetical protein
MGQCSTLPAEARSPSSPYDGNYAQKYRQHDEVRDNEESTRRIRDGGRQENLDFSKITVGQYSHSSSRKENSEEGEVTDSDPMDIDARDGPTPPPPPPIALPPVSAVRTRCYKLNLGSEALGLPSNQKLQMWLGPFNEPPPQLTYSMSDDASGESSGVSVAIKTAQIFRGITVGVDGTILSQNARATRSNRGNKTKRGEKSRQAAKIDKANDLVEESIATGKAPDSDEPANLVSLFVVGEYDDMKHLVRDGAKKLRDSTELPDEILMSINKSRISLRPKSALSSNNGSINSIIRESPSLVHSQRESNKIQLTGTIVSKLNSPTAPPKLKVHPRDNRSGRREDRAGMRVRLGACHAGPIHDGEWTHAWNLWNCGGAGNVSPVQPSSPSEQSPAMFEARDPNFGAAREGGLATRA